MSYRRVSEYKPASGEVKYTKDISNKNNKFEKPQMNVSDCPHNPSTDLYF